MRPIPPKIREQISLDPFYRFCIHERYRGIPAKGRITIEHAWIYAGRQINDLWALVPCSEEKNVGVSGDDKKFNQYVALLRAKELGVWDELKNNYPRRDWDQEFERLKSIFPKI